MRQLALIFFASIAVAGCDTTGMMTSPAPLQQTVIDDRAVRWGFQALDALATLADSAVEAKLIIPGSPKALAIADGLEKSKAALNAASAAQRAGSVASYNEAFEQASRAMAEVKKALGK